MEFLGDGVMLALYGAILGIVMLGVGREVWEESLMGPPAKTKAEEAPADLLKPAPNPA